MTSPLSTLNGNALVAAHILMCIGYFQGKEKLTSDFLAGSVNVNPVVIRNTLGKLKKAGIVRVEAGIGGASLARDPSDITLLDIFSAVETDTDLFHFHEPHQVSHLLEKSPSPESHRQSHHLNPEHRPLPRLLLLPQKQVQPTPTHILQL